ncbi:MAG: efflux transporter periplasmic adaptor subunit [Burkholderiales bacterium]|nr:MAG: efflux transporter periplasmic adaptor subunit [Burkholderiales bacterium]
MNTQPSQQKPKTKQFVLIGIVVAIGLALGAVLLSSGKSQPAGGEDAHGAHAEAEGHDEKEHHGEAKKDGHADEKDHADEEHHETTTAAPAKGPNGGRLFAAGDFGLELTIFETGVEPQFRIYTYRDGKPTDPAQVQATVSVERLGRKPQVVAFTKEGNYLKGDAVVEEPHSFAVRIEAQETGNTHEFKFEQVEARVTMNEAQLKANGVEIGAVGPARIKTALQLQGEVRLNEDRTVHVVPRLTGLVESVSANAGDRVRRGQVLAVLSSQSLADQRSELLAAQKRLGLARTTLEREKKLWDEKISAEQDYLQARQVFAEAEIAEQSARQKLASLGAVAVATPTPGSLTRYEVRSPIDGVITDKKISVGEVVREDSNIFIVADLSSVWIEMTVYAKDLNAVMLGQQATVKATSFEAQAVGKVSYVGNLVGEQTRAATARMVLPNPKGLWRPGLPVNVELTAEEVEVPLAIAVDAVQSLRDWTVVFGRYGEQFEARPLTLGRSDGKMVEVLSGLEAGERYASRNSFLVKADIGKAGASHDH